MKKITILGLFLLGLGFSPLLAKADVIPTGMHSVDRCAYITNLSDFPDLYIIENMIAGMPGDTPNISNIIVKNDKCLTRNSMYYDSVLYIFNREYIDSIGIENFNIESIPKKDLIELETNFDGRYISNMTSLQKQDTYYLLVKDSEGKYTLKKDKTISDYSDGIRGKVETFLNGGEEKIKKEIKKEIEPVTKDEIEKEKDVPFEGDDIINPQQNMVKKGFWQKVKCFFGFKKNC